jgi:hypothetical protein
VVSGKDVPGPQVIVGKREVAVTGPSGEEQKRHGAAGWWLCVRQGCEPRVVVA